MDLISIIMPCFNMERYIQASVQTVIEQTYPNWELLIVDDGSSDNSVCIIQKLIEMDSRIKLIQLEKNGGIAHARNTALQQAKGTYIAFLDSDDFWHPDKLQLQLQFMKEKKAAISFTAYKQITETGTLIKTISAPPMINYHTLLKKNVIGCLTVMINRSATGNFIMPKLKHEDFATWLYLLKETTSYAYGLNIPLASYNLRQGSTSRNKIKSMLWVYTIYRRQEHLTIAKSFFYILRWLYYTIK